MYPEQHPVQFSGTVIGGPAAGKFMQSPSEFLRVWKNDTPLDFTLEVVPTNATVDEFTYRHVEMHRHNDATGQRTVLGYWVPEDEARQNKDPILYVLRVLTSSYVQRGNHGKRVVRSRRQAAG